MLSRCRVFVLNSLSVSDVEEVLQHALKHPHGFPGMIINCEEGVIPLIAQFANGDARIALNTFEMAVLNSEKNEQKVTLTMDTLKQLINTKSLRYDKKGEEHYNIISALHKSMRNSDVDAAVYWCSRMIDGGEDPLYIVRRLVRFASEGIGLADTNALQVAVNTFNACQLFWNA